MFLHDINFDQFHIACEDTLITPYFREDEGDFEVIVSNPPYSIKWAGDENPLLINDPRFAPAGVLAPKSKADNPDRGSRASGSIPPHRRSGKRPVAFPARYKRVRCPGSAAVREGSADPTAEKSSPESSGNIR